MRFPKFRGGRTAVAVATLTATTGALLLVSAAPAAAVTNSWTVTADSQTIIFPATAGQAVPNEVVGTADNGAGVTIGDQLKLTVDDSTTGDNCALTNDFIEFSAPPTLTVDTPTTGAPTYSLTLGSSAGSCATAGKKDQVIITATSSGASGSFTLSGISYNTGSAVEAGNVDISATANNGAAVDVSSASNATISLVKVTANTPPTGITEHSTGSAIPDITLQEFATGAIPAGTPGFVCITVLPTDGGTGVFSGVGAATASGGGAVASDAHVGTTTAVATSPSVSFAYTASTSGSTTVTVSGLTFNSTGGEKFIPVRIGTHASNRGTACTNSNLSTLTNIGFIVDLNRLGGGDRFATAQIIFHSQFDCTFGSGTADTAIIARGDNFPDALAASYLAGSMSTGILLVNTNDIPASTLNALRIEGVNNVILVGGTAAIAQSVQDQLAATPQYDCNGAPVGGNPPLNVSRISGQTRYETARAVAEFPGLTNAGTIDMDLDATGSGSGNDCQPTVTAIVASGENFPDALAAGPLASAGAEGACGSADDHGLPLLLTPKDSLSSDAAAALVDINVKQVILMGGTAAVSTATEAQITALGIKVIRVAGTSRQLTAAALAALMADPSNINFADGNVGLSRPDTFPDALTLGPLAGEYGLAILLTDSPTSLGSAAAGVITNLSSQVNLGGFPPECTDDIHLAGGTAALSAGVATEALNAAAAQSALHCPYAPPEGP